MELELVEVCVAFNEDARAAVDDLVLETVLLDVFDHRCVFCSGLDPECRDTRSLGLLEDTEGNLCCGDDEIMKHTSGFVSFFQVTRLNEKYWTFGGVIMLIEVSVGLGRSETARSVFTPSSSSSFYSTEFG